MKKKRGYVRKLKVELQELKESNDYLIDMLDIRARSLADVSLKLSSLRNRMRILQNVHQISPYEFGVTIDDIKKNMVKELLYNEVFMDAIKVERDDDYKGIGSRLRLSVMVLTQE